MSYFTYALQLVRNTSRISHRRSDSRLRRSLRFGEGERREKRCFLWRILSWWVSSSSTIRESRGAIYIARFVGRYDKDAS
jgi:hypothetical protein